LRANRSFQHFDDLARAVFNLLNSIFSNYQNPKSS
jgi:hypothetical protein